MTIPNIIKAIRRIVNNAHCFQNIEAYNEIKRVLNNDRYVSNNPSGALIQLWEMLRKRDGEVRKKLSLLPNVKKEKALIDMLQEEMVMSTITPILISGADLTRFLNHINKKTPGYLEEIAKRNFDKNKREIIAIGASETGKFIINKNVLSHVGVATRKVFKKKDRKFKAKTPSERYIKSKLLSKSLKFVSAMPELKRKLSSVFVAFSTELKHKSIDAHADKVLDESLLDTFIEEVASNKKVQIGIEAIETPIREAVVSLQEDFLKGASDTTRDFLRKRGLTLCPELSAIQAQIHTLEKEISEAYFFNPMIPRKKIKIKILENIYKELKDGEELTQKLIDRCCMLKCDGSEKKVSFKEVLYKGQFSGGEFSLTKEKCTFSSRTANVLNRFVRLNEQKKVTQHKTWAPSRPNCQKLS